jgi:hypothetical protein
VWTELKFLEFLRAKEHTTIDDITWDEDQLKYTLHSTLAHENGVTHLVPLVFNKKTITEVSANGSPYAYSVQEIKGRRYALITVNPGSLYSFSITYGD